MENKVSKKRKNAFSVLCDQRKRLNQGKRSKATATLPKTAECPVCFRSFECKKLELHVQNHFLAKKKVSRKSVEKCGIKQLSKVSTVSSPGQTASNALQHIMDKAKQKPRKEFFHLDKPTQAIPVHSCRWNVEHMAEKGVWRSETSITRDKTIGYQAGVLVITTNEAPPSDGARLLLLQPAMPENISVSVIKSALQKNVRRRRGDQAARCAFWLMKKSFTDFIRRLPVIILEDSVLNPQFAVVVWFMVAESKGYTPSNKDAHYLVNIVKQIALCKYRDPLPEFSDEDALKINAFGTKGCDDLSGQKGVLCRAILCRARFGGMRGDVSMLIKYAFLWHRRFRGSDHDPIPPAIGNGLSQTCSDGNQWMSLVQSVHVPFTPLAFSDFRNLGKKDIPLAGVDFHCIPKIIDTAVSAYAKKVKEPINSDTPGNLKSAMWYFSSSVNHKLLLDGGKTASSGTLEDRRKLLPLWSKCSPFIIEFQRNYLDARFR